MGRQTQNRRRRRLRRQKRKRARLRWQLLELTAEVGRLRALVVELEAEVATALPSRHYLAQMHQIAVMAADDEDLQLAQLGGVLGEALDVVEVHQLLIDQRLEELGRGEPPAPPELRVVGGGR